MLREDKWHQDVMSTNDISETMTIGESGKIRAATERIGEKNRQPEYAGFAEMACAY